MIVPPTGVRVLVATKPVDFRRGMDGLAAYVQEALKTNPFSGVIYVFRAKRANQTSFRIPIAVRACRLSLASAQRPATARPPTIVSRWLRSAVSRRSPGRAAGAAGLDVRRIALRCDDARAAFGLDRSPARLVGLARSSLRESAARGTIACLDKEEAPT